MKLFKIVFLLFINLMSNTLKAQQNTISNGGDISGFGGSVAFSIGQIDYTTNTNGTIFTCEGVQKPYEFFECIENNNFPIDVSIFPNPGSDILNIRIENCCNNNLSFQIIDGLGRLIKNKTSITNQSIVNVTHLSSSVYFIKFYKDGNLIKTVKFLKL
jgi:hypothetical protein